MGRTGGWDGRDHDAFLRVWNSIFGSADLCSPNKQPPRTKAASTPTAAASVAPDHNADNNANAEAPEPVNPYAVTMTNTQKSQLYKKLEFHVIGKSKEELQQHVEWYSKILELQARKKTLVNDWKRVQSNRRKSAANELLASEQVLDIAEDVDAILDEANQQLDENAVTSQESGSEQEKRNATKAKIAQWRQEKEQQKKLDQVNTPI
jgi:hypothetical protein